MSSITRTDGPTPASTRPGSRHRAAVIATTAPLATTIVVWHGLHPTRTTAVALEAVRAVLYLVVAFVPLLLRARPRRVWLLLTVACVPTLVASALVIVDPGRFPEAPARLGAVSVVDALDLAAMAFTGLWMLAMTWRVAGVRILAWTALDTVTVTLGCVLLVVAVAPYLPLIRMAGDPTWAMYPIADLTMIGFAGQLLLRLDRRSPVLWWGLSSLVLTLGIDLAYTYCALVDPTRPPAWIPACYILTSYALAAAVTHPSILQLSSAPPPPVVEDSAAVRHAYLILATATILAALLVPPLDLQTMRVRSLLLVALTLLLFLRLGTAHSRLLSAERRSTYRATHDDLTGLLNRRALFAALNPRLRLDRAAHRCTSLIHVDCDGLRTVNDTWGHVAGDRVLTTLAGRLTEFTGPQDTLARISGDQFVLVSDVADPVEVDDLAARIRRRCMEPVCVAHHRAHTVTVGMGIAVATPEEVITGRDLIERADLALHAAKTAGRDQRVVYGPALRDRALTRAVMSDALRDAVAAGSLTVAFQPIRTGPGYGELCGWEALARWEAPAFGAVAPSEFIPLAEELGLIVPLGELVLRTSVRRFAELRRELGRDDLRLSVNVSAPQLLVDDFVPTVDEILKECDVPPSALFLEVTESLLVEDDSPAMAALDRLRSLGVRLSLDDFGTGYASIASLLRLPVDCAKVDRSLVLRADAEDQDRGVDQLSAVLALLRSVGVDHIVAEGIETPRQARMVEDLGCPAVQGFLFGRPTAPDAILAAHRAQGPTHI